MHGKILKIINKNVNKYSLLGVDNFIIIFSNFLIQNKEKFEN